MELALNLIWLALSLSAVTAWLAGYIWGHRCYQPARMRKEGIALVCALVLLFFPISMTDDLHPELIANCECSMQRRASHPLLKGLSSDRELHLHTPLIAMGREAARLCTNSRFASFSAERFALDSQSTPESSKDRAPPHCAA